MFSLLKVFLSTCCDLLEKPFNAKRTSISCELAGTGLISSFVTSVSGSYIVAKAKRFE